MAPSKFSSLLSLLTATLVLNVVSVVAFPAYQSLAGIEARQMDDILASGSLVPRVPPPPPGPMPFLGSKLVNDAAHPFIAPKPTDLRGPCPGLNTLANHGYIPRNGIATPAQLIIGVQEGFNMENVVARFTTYVNHLIDGNLVTDLISIGDKTPKTGMQPPPPAPVAGMNHHGTFEGDASISRGDAYFGDNHSFNPELFEQFKNFSSIYGGGFYNLTVASELRAHRYQQSIETNPEFRFMGLRHITAFAEASFPAVFFVDGRRTAPGEKFHLDMVTAERFLKEMHMPEDFHRAATPQQGESGFLFSHRPILPGRNVNGANTFQVDESLGSLLDFCNFYTQFVNVTVKGFYPNPTGVLKRNLNINLQFLFDNLPVAPDAGCTQVFPYGQD
ncbi:Chloroperoxidase [Coprinopsis sp. MPI-PUGE-AT-0042]|nr:Chloroperoxidase [Coprinopsis sp. MPI-PUGE-AT-0042]KAH6905580.1 Chloroperoxidase [Coprinopsis sp. MPI-PUGE-AT-0042]